MPKSFVRGGHLLALAGLLLLLVPRLAFAHEGHHERIEFLTKQVEKTPSDPLLYFQLATAYAEHGDLELALKNLERVDALAPGSFPTDLARGEALVAADKPEQAKEALDRQLISHPETTRAWLLRARAERKLAQREASAADYHEALARTASLDPDMVQEVADALAADNRKEEAAKVLTAGIAKLGNVPSLVLRAVDLDIEMKNFDGALVRLDQAQHDASRPEPWMARRAAVLTKAGRTEESRAAWQALIAHLASLPEHERSSRAMSKLSSDADQALAALKSSLVDDQATSEKAVAGPARP